MSTPDCFRARPDAMIDLQHALVALARQLRWDRIEQALAPKLAHRDRAGRQLIVDDLLGPYQVELGAGVNNADWPRLPNLLQDLGPSPTQTIVDLGYRGVDADNASVEPIHRGTYKTPTSQQRCRLKRRQAIGPTIGHAESDNRMNRCWIQCALGDALQALSRAGGCDTRWVMPALAGLVAGWSSLALLGPLPHLRITVAKLAAWLVGAQRPLPDAIDRPAGPGVLQFGRSSQLGYAGN